MTGPPSVPHELLTRCIENVTERSRRSARAIDGWVLIEGSGLLLIAADGMPWITGATITRVPSDPAATLARAASFFEERALNWGLTAAGAVADTISPAAEAHGLARGERRPGMLLMPIGGEPPLVPGLEIREVRDPAMLAAFIATSAAGFGGDASLFALMYQPSALSVPDHTLYLGLLDGAPVATAVRVTSHRIAGIGGVSTIPAARRRGIGEAITRRAALDGLAEGCLASFLQASEMGYGLYERMGFRHVIDFHTWEASGT
jgi:GNAT superfamily N-acetyltransferase